jgi:hypothetical protein
MAISRTPMIDDDGSGTTGTIINNAWKQEFYNQIDALAGGTWSPVPFNAGDFFCDAGTWTVPSVAAQRFMVLGKTLRYHVYIPTSTIAGASQLGIKLPAGYAVAAELHDLVLINDGGAFVAGAHLYALPSNSNLTIVRMSGAWGGGNTGVYVSTTIEIF